MGYAGQDATRGPKMAEHSPGHSPGSMDIRTQEKTFHGFIRLVKWAFIIVFGVLIFLALVNA